MKHGLADHSSQLFFLCGEPLQILYSRGVILVITLMMMLAQSTVPAQTPTPTPPPPVPAADYSGFLGGDGYAWNWATPGAPYTGHALVNNGNPHQGFDGTTLPDALENN